MHQDIHMHVLHVERLFPDASALVLLQTPGLANLNHGPSDVELAKPYFDGQQLVQNNREASGHEASARYTDTVCVLM